MRVNDVHSGLNSTEVADVVHAASVDDVVTALARARAEGVPLTAAGGRHAMGGQQFTTGGLLLDTGALDRVVHLDRERGLVEVEAGIQWPHLVAQLTALQEDGGPAWGIRQKQTGADRFCMGGSVSVNAHGRGLRMAPLAGDVESLRLVLPDGRPVEASRDVEPTLFAHVLGGYGLFGVITSVNLRLAPRRLLERVVQVLATDELSDAVTARVADGYLYGDLQFAIDPRSPDFLRVGVFSCYRPAPAGTPVPPAQRILSTEDWQLLLDLAHYDKARAFEQYVQHYLATSGQLYWSDEHQLAHYTDGYHARIDVARGGPPASEVIGELYVPPERLADFTAAMAEDLRVHAVDVIYGTIRFIEPDVDTALPWARRRLACVVVNVHTEHTPEGVAATAAAFRRLIDLALDRGGSYFLTYHRWARPDQLLRAYPELPDVVARQRELDPDGVLTSDWYRHHVLPAVG